MSGAYRTKVISTDGVPRPEQGDFWVAQLTAMLFSLEVRYKGSSPAAFRGRLTRQATERYQIDLVDSQEGCLKRTEQHVRQDSNDSYRLLAVGSGSMLFSSADQTARLTRGSAGLMSLDSPFEITSKPTRTWIMTIPRAEIDRQVDPPAPLTMGIDFGKGLGRVVGGMIQQLHEQRAALSAQQFDAVCDRLVELLCMLSIGQDRPDLSDNLSDVAAAIRRYIRDHAHDPTLTSSSVADALGWSRRQVQLAMQRAGTTPRDVIRDERLRLARERLLSPACQHLTISQIALTSGFTSLSSLSTAFRQRYGEAPRDYRGDHVAEMAGRSVIGSSADAKDPRSR